MSYRYATEDINYEDYASGRVFYSQPGTTSFPVRLASEIFQRCKALLAESGIGGPYTLYDPCCGGAYLLTALGFLFGSDLVHIYASDVDEGAVQLAKKNLALLSQAGLEERTAQIRRMMAEFGKASHEEALKSASRLLQLNEQRPQPIHVCCFTADATKRDEHCLAQEVQMVITDLPYGEVVNWVQAAGEGDAAGLLLDSLLPKLAPQAVVAVVARKKTAIQHPAYQRAEHFTLGKRQIVILRV